MENYDKFAPTLAAVKRDLLFIETYHMQGKMEPCIDINDIKQASGKVSEQGTVRFLQDHYQDILRLTGDGAISRSTVDKLEDILKYQKGPGAAEIITASTVGGALGGAVGTTVDRNAHLGDYAAGGGKGAAVGATLGVAAAAIKDYQDNAMAKRQAEMNSWDMAQYKDRDKHNLKYEHFDKIAAILPSLDLNHDGFLDKSELRAAGSKNQELLPELKFVEENISSLAKLANGSLEQDSPADKVSAKDIRALYNGAQHEHVVPTTSNLALLGTTGALVGGGLGALAGAGVFSAPGAAIGASIGSSVFVGVGHLIQKGTDSYGREERNKERQQIYSELHDKIERS